MVNVAICLLYTRAPRILPSIFNGSRLFLFRLLEGDVKVGEGKVALIAGHIREELGIEREPILTGELLHKMFGRKMIQELEEDAHVGRNEKELIKDLSVKYGILSKFTSFVGVDEATAKEVRQVDNMMPTIKSSGHESHELRSNNDENLQCHEMQYRRRIVHEEGKNKYINKGA